jgi:hypothetical protein
MEHRRASGASTRSMLHPTSLPPTTKFAPLLPRGALIAVITVFHRLVTPLRHTVDRLGRWWVCRRL